MRGRCRSSAMVSPCSASSFGRTFSPSGPPRRTPVSQVRWLRPTWSRCTSAGVDPEQRGELPLEADRHVAQSDGLVTGLEQRARHDADRVGEVDDPGVRVGVRRTRSAMSRTTGTVRSALARPPAPVVSCPTQPHSSGQVSSSLRAACPPTRSCSSTASAPSTPASRSAVVTIRAGVPLPREDPPGESADQLQALRGRVDEHQLLDGQGVPQPGEAVDEFGGVGRPSADHGEFHGSTLHSGERDTLDERLLREEEHEDHGGHDQHGRGHGEVPVGVVRALERLQAVGRASRRRGSREA